MALEASGEGGGIGPGRTGGPGSTTGTGSHQHRYLRLVPLGVQDVPHHRELDAAASAPSARPGLEDFLKDVLNEAKEFNVSEWPQTGIHKFGKKSVAAGVDVAHHKKQLGDDVWFARYSKHPETSGSPGPSPGNNGLAKLMQWNVLDYVLRKDHSKHEAQYTPNIFDLALVLKWTISPEVAGRCGMKNMFLGIVNMYHGMPSPLWNRLFTVLVLTGVRTDVPQDKLKHESIIVQIPVDLKAFPDEVKMRCHHHDDSHLVFSPPPDCVNAENYSIVGKKLVQGTYASIEKVSSIEHVIHWGMATASDAKGNLPQFVQRMAVPGEIVKDIEYVYSYMKERQEALLQLVV